MNTRRTNFLTKLGTALALALTLAACGGGGGSAPPGTAGSVVNPAAPVVTITNNVTAETATGDIVFTFSFNRDVGTSFTVDDITVVNGTKGAFTRLSGTQATLVVTPASGTSGQVGVLVPAGAVTDAVGVPNAAVSAQKAFNTIVAPVRTVVVSFDESTTPTLAGFGGAEDAAVVPDPTDAANKVARVIKSSTAQVWAGTTVSICPNNAIVRLPFTNTLTSMTARVWSPAAGVPVRLKVEDSTDGNKSVETEATVSVANAWQTLTFNFANHAAATTPLNTATTYDKASIFFNFGTDGATTGTRTYYVDAIAFEGASFSVACPGLSVATITMDESTPPVLTGFGGAEDAAIELNPVAGSNNKVARIKKGSNAEVWAGTTISTDTGLSIPTIAFSTTNKTITARVWSPVAGIPVRMKVENATVGAQSVETEATVTAANTWQNLTFNFNNHSSGTLPLSLTTTYNKLSVFFDFGTSGATVGSTRTYYIEDIVYPVAPSAGTLTFASGFTAGGGTAQGGSWGYFSGDFGSYDNTYTGGGFADSTPPVTDDLQYFYIAVTTTAPTAPSGTPPNSGGYLGMYVTHPGLTLTGQTKLAVNLAMDSNFFQQASNKDIEVRVVGATQYSNGSGGLCNVTLLGTVTPTTDAMRTYELTLANMTLAQACNGGGFNSGVTTVAQALAQPIGAVNTQFTYPNVNTTVQNGGVYATGITRGKTVFR